MSIIFLIGIIGNLAFAFKSSFQIIKCYKNKSAKDVSMGMITSDFIGNVCCAAFIFGTTGFYQWPQFVNYGFATLFLIILMGMKIYYDRKTRV